MRHAAIGLFTKDVRADYTRLKQAGVVFLGEPEYSEEGKVTFVKFDDTCGNLINLIQKKA